jgi:hypothetical protein
MNDADVKNLIAQYAHAQFKVREYTDLMKSTEAQLVEELVNRKMYEFVKVNWTMVNRHF